MKVMSTCRREIFDMLSLSGTRGEGYLRMNKTREYRIGKAS